MKIEINVLPDKQKEKIKEEKKIGFTIRLIFGFIAVLILINVVLYLMQTVLGIEYKAAKESSGASLIKSSGKENQLEKNFQDTNDQVAKTSKISLNLPNWARVLARISELCPDGIRVSQFSADGAQLKISGFSKSREAFLDFQDKLQNEGFQFSTDISNLVASKDFNFVLATNIPQDYLNRK